MFLEKGSRDVMSVACCLSLKSGSVAILLILNLNRIPYISYIFCRYSKHIDLQSRKHPFFPLFIYFKFSLSSLLKGFKLGSEKHTTEVILKKSGALKVTSGIEGLALLKTTKVILSNSLLISRFSKLNT